jgi:hypothetical protein
MLAFREDWRKRPKSRHGRSYGGDVGFVRYISAAMRNQDRRFVSLYQAGQASHQSNWGSSPLPRGFLHSDFFNHLYRNQNIVVSATGSASRQPALAIVTLDSVHTTVSGRDPI